MSIKKLPLTSGNKIVKVFEHFGWVSAYGKNHFVLSHPGVPPALKISIPDRREVDRALLKAEIRKALATGITEENFLEIYERL